MPKLAVAASVPNVPRGSLVTRSRLAIALAAAALNVTLVRGRRTPAVPTSGATASLSSVVRRPPSSALMRGLPPSSKRTEPSVSARLRVRSCSVPVVLSAFASPPASGSVTRRPLRVALPVARTVTPRASSACSVRGAQRERDRAAGLRVRRRGEQRERGDRERDRPHGLGTAIVNEPHPLPAG